MVISILIIQWTQFYFNSLNLGSEGYYTHPYSAYERGTNERMNGLIRRFIPKGKKISKISKEGIRRIRDWYNSLPRKIFNNKSSIEKFLIEMKEYVK